MSHERTATATAPFFSTHRDIPAYVPRRDRRGVLVSRGTQNALVTPSPPKFGSREGLCRYLRLPVWTLWSHWHILTGGGPGPPNQDRVHTHRRPAPSLFGLPL